MNRGDISTDWTRPRLSLGLYIRAGRVGAVLHRSGAVSDNGQTGCRGICDAQRQRTDRGRRETKMLHYAVVFFIIAIVAAILGFGGIAAGAAGIAKVLFFVFLILAVITFLRRA